MRTSLIANLTISIIAVMVIGGCASSSKTSQKANFKAFEKNAVGQWFNMDKATSSTTKLVITRNGDKWLIEGWGACHPTDCNWGEVQLFLVGETVNDKSFKHGFAIWDFDFKSTYMTLQIIDEHLSIETIDIFKDGCGRSNYSKAEKFDR